jgi:hypothetical protein
MVDMGNRLIRVSQVLVVCFVRQNLVLGFVGQRFVFSLMEYIDFVSLGAKGSIFGCPKMIGCSLVVE